MNTNDVRTLFAYNRWANERMLAAASQLTPGEFDRDLGASFGSVRGTLFHILFGEWRWFRFWQDGSLIPSPPLDDFPDTAALQRSLLELERERNAFLATLTDQRLEARLTVREQDFTLGELIQHIINHSTYHRGQVVLLLKLLGQAPPATDYRLYLSLDR